MTPTQLAKSGTEHAHQRALFAWANMAEKYGLEAASDELSYTLKGHAESYGIQSLKLNNDLVPQLKWLHAIHNQGHGDAIRGAKAKAEGVKAGIWDIFLPVTTINRYVDDTKNHPLGYILAYCGLYIEMKVGKNTLTTEQSEFGQYAIQQGYKTVVCWDWRDGRDYIIEYLGL